MRRLAARALGRVKYLPALDVLGRLLQTGDGETAVVLAEAMAAMESSEAEPALPHALDREENVRQAAARALEGVGTVAAVPALRSLADSVQ